MVFQIFNIIDGQKAQPAYQIQMSCNCENCQNQTRSCAKCINASLIHSHMTCLFALFIYYEIIQKFVQFEPTQIITGFGTLGDVTMTSSISKCIFEWESVNFSKTLFCLICQHIF